MCPSSDGRQASGSPRSARPGQVAIIANPQAGKDVRRLVGYGATSDNLGKVKTLQRLLVGLIEAGVARVPFMPDPAGLVSVAWEGLRQEERGALILEPLLEAVGGEATDTEAAARAAASRPLGCLVTLGGDGTNRLVARHVGDLPLVPLSTGTNNTFPYFFEPTLAGLAAGLVASGQVAAAEACRRAKALQVGIGGRHDLALVDVAFLPGGFVGARAVWRPDEVSQLVCSQAEPTSLGLSSIAAQVEPAGRDELFGVYAELGRGVEVRAAILPGGFASVFVHTVRRLEPGDSVLLGPGPGVLALDGERLLPLAKGETARVQLTGGPLVVLPERVLARHGALRRTD